MVHEHSKHTNHIHVHVYRDDHIQCVRTSTHMYMYMYRTRTDMVMDIPTTQMETIILVSEQLTW